MHFYHLYKQILLWVVVSLVCCLTSIAQTTEPSDMSIEALYQQAAAFHNAGEYEKAIETYSSVIARDPSHVDAYWKRGHIYGLQGQYERAAADFRKVIELLPESGNGYGALGWYLMVQGKFEEAEVPCQKAAQLAPENFAWTMNLGHLALLSGDAAGARAYYERALPLITSEQTFTTGPVADFEFFIKQGWQEEASRRELAWIQQEYETFYRQANAFGTQADALFAEGQHLKAAQQYEKAIEAEQANPKLRPTYLADILQMAGYTCEQAERYDKSQIYYEQALERNRALQREDRMVVLLNSLAAFYHTGRQFDQAIAYYEQALELARKLGQERRATVLLNSMGMLYHTWGQYEKSLERYQQVLKRLSSGDESSLAILFSNMGMVYQEQGDYDEALKTYKRGLELARKLDQKATMSTLLSNMGLIYDVRGEYENALVYHQQTLELSRELGDDYGINTALNNIGGVYDARGDYETALEYYAKALESARKRGDESSIATALNNIGGVYNARGDYQNALSHYEQALQIHQKLRDDVSISTLLNNIGAIYSATGDYKQALEYYQQGLDLAHTLGGKPGMMLSLNNIGMLLNLQGDSARASEYFAQALELAQTMGDESAIATVLNNIGMLYDAQGDYPNALVKYEQVLAIFTKLGEEANITTALNNIGAVYRSWGQYEKALEYFAQAIDIDRKLGREGDVVRDINNIGYVYHSWGQYDKAIANYENALDVARKQGDRSKITTVLNNLGAVYEAWGVYPKALEYYQHALDDARIIGEEASVAVYLNNIGGIYELQENYDTALTYFEDALALARKIGDNAQIATLLNNIGGMYHFKELYDKAIEYYQQALEIDRKAGRDADAAIRINNIGTVYHSWKQYEQAIEHFQQALDIFRTSGEEANIALSLSNIGAMYYEQKNYPESIAYLEQTVEMLEKLRKTAAGGVRRDYLASQIKNYQVLASCYFHINDLARVLHTIELSRAKLLGEQLAGSEEKVQIPTLEQIQSSLAEDTAVLIYANVDMQHIIQLLMTKDHAAMMESSLDQSHERSESSEPRLTSFSNLSGGIPEDSRGLNLNQKIRMADETSKPDESLDLNTIIEEYRARLQNPSFSRGITFDQPETIENFGDQQEEKAASLYTLLLGNVSDQLHGKTRLIIVPDGILNFLPFETLTDDAGKYLVETCQISYVQSLSVLNAIRQRHYPPDRKSVLAFGGAVYEHQTYTGEMVENAPQLAYLRNQVNDALNRGNSLAAAYDSLGFRWSNLPGTLHEVKAIQDVVRDARLVTGEDVSETRIKSLAKEGELTQYKVIHFATHGIAVPDIPELSALVLSQNEDASSLADGDLAGNDTPRGPSRGELKEILPGEEDGYLSIHEVAELNIKADFVNLSACQTGLGKIYSGEGVVGLTQAFLIAGANGLSVSLWSVADESTAQFMAALYILVEKQGFSYADAVTEIKRRFIRGDFGEKWKAPYYWAPFVYYGQ